MVDVGDVLAAATREPASLVPAPDLDPLGLGGVTLQLLLVEAGAIGRIERQRDVRVAGEAPSHLGRNRTDTFDGGVAVAVAVEEAIEVGVHDHGGPGATVDRFGGSAPARGEGFLRPCSTQIWTRASAQRLSKRT